MDVLPMPEGTDSELYMTCWWIDSFRHFQLKAQSDIATEPFTDILRLKLWLMATIL